MREEEYFDEVEGNMYDGFGLLSKDFKLAMLEKRHKILEAKMEFIKKMKELVKNMPEEKDEM